MNDYHKSEEAFYRALELHDEEKAEALLLQLEVDYPLAENLGTLRRDFLRMKLNTATHFQPKKREVVQKMIRFGVIFLCVALVGITLIFTLKKIYKIREERKISTKVETYLDKAKQLEEKNEFKDALNSLNLAYKLSDNDPKIQSDIARILAKIGDDYFEKKKYSDALSYYQNALNSDEENVLYKVNLAITFYRLGKNTRNRTFYQKGLDILNSVKEEDMTASVYRSKGHILIRMDKSEEAIKVWKKLVDTFPNSEEAKEVKGYLKNYGYNY